MSEAANIILLMELQKREKENNAVLDEIKYSHLIATLYVLKEKPIKNINKIKEEIIMTKSSGKLSNRTMIIIGIVGGAVVLGLGALGISIARDVRETKNIENDYSDAEAIAEAVADVIDELGNAVEDAAASIES